MAQFDEKVRKLVHDLEGLDLIVGVRRIGSGLPESSPPIPTRPKQALFATGSNAIPDLGVAGVKRVTLPSFSEAGDRVSKRRKLESLVHGGAP